MEEGQLKKRIVAQSNNGLSPEEKDGDINSEDLLQWLDEAEKEFPAWYVVSLPECEGRIYKWDEMTEEQRKNAKVKSVDVDETVVWFKKWFGGENE
jgi:hypothetical protein